METSPYFEGVPSQHACDEYSITYERHVAVFGSAFRWRCFWQMGDVNDRITTVALLFVFEFPGAWRSDGADQRAHLEK